MLLIGANPRWDAPVLNARIRKAWLGGALKIAGFGVSLDQTYPVENLGNDLSALSKIADGSHVFAKVLKDAKRPMVIVGSSVAARADGAGNGSASAGRKH